MWSTGVGSHPGDDARDYAEAVRVVVGEVPGLPYVPELPGRGAIASITGRGCAVLAALGVDLQPAGWRLTDAPGVDHRRARSLLAQDLDAVEESTQDHRGWFKTQIAGPWTLAATVERPRGDKLISDHGARRELAQSLAEGLTTHVEDLRRRLPGVTRLIVQLDEPALPAVLAGQVPTASGFGRHRSVHAPEASEAIEWVAAAIEAAGGEPWLHSCAADTPYPMLADAGIKGFLIDPAQCSPADLEHLGSFLEAGHSLGVGVVGSVTATDRQLTERTLRWLDLVGLAPGEVHDTLGVTGTCGWTNQSPEWVKTTLGALRAAADHLGQE